VAGFEIIFRPVWPLAYSQEMRGKTSSAGKGGGELDLLREIRKQASRGVRGKGLRLGIGDDCALLAVKDGEELAVTTDLSIAGRHFRTDWHPPESVGHRALARGLSDLAAMGARPVAAFLSLGVPRELTVSRGRGGANGGRSWVERFYDGLFRIAGAHKTPLAGGDLAESPIALADIVVVGAVPNGRALLRSGARPGDLLYVTGSLGGAAAGLAKLAAAGGRLRRGAVKGVLSRHLYPEPRIKLGLVLQRRGLAAAAIDLSDGLSTDLGHLCEESEVGAVVHAEMVPLMEGASLEQALHGGEDYELLFTARPAIRVPRSIGGVRITRIGEVTRRRAGETQANIATARIVEPLEPRGWEHFS
jgi:thiamine-monophosphate kinase